MWTGSKVTQSDCSVQYLSMVSTIIVTYRITLGSFKVRLYRVILTLFPIVTHNLQYDKRTGAVSKAVCKM